MHIIIEEEIIIIDLYYAYMSNIKEDDYYFIEFHIYIYIYIYI